MAIQVKYKPDTAVDQASLEENRRVVDTVVRFFLFAPNVCIQEVRDKLLSEGFELIMQPAAQMQLMNPFTGPNFYDPDKQD
jgi:hypothetical protein